MNSEIEEIVNAIEMMALEAGATWSVKQMERQRKSLENQLEELQREDYKDDVITFEELGVDAIMIDEAHEYKNLTFTTKMSNVAGINPNGAKKSMDLFLKIQYIQELTLGKNVVFATGTPISNTMCEMYIMQKYLQPDRLKELGIYHFDSWAANFGETITSLEMAVEGSGYRQKTRFAKFSNLPELVSLYKEFADVQLPDMLNLKIPKLKNNNYTIVECEPNDDIRTIMQTFVERAGKIHEGQVDPSTDNMLKICNEAKLLSTDIRLLDSTAVNDSGSKLNQCVDNLVTVYKESDDIKGTQVVFCDVGTPGSSKKFNVYDYIKQELIKRGIPENEICFIHDVKSDKQRDDMFNDLRNGTKRIIFGSTSKMGTGTNIQKRLYAMHEIDVPWRPSDVEQREGRILRQGNMNEEVEIYRYVTKETFDAYNWNIIMNKQKFICQVMTSKEVSRTADDIDESVLSYSEIMAIASGNPMIKEKMEVDIEVQKLKLLKLNYNNNRYRLENNFSQTLQRELSRYKDVKKLVEADIELRNKSAFFSKNAAYERETENEDGFVITIKGEVYTDREEAGISFINLCSEMNIDEVRMLGNFFGFEIGMEKHYYMGEVAFELIVTGNTSYHTLASSNAVGNMVKFKNLLMKLDEKKENLSTKISDVEKNIEVSRVEYDKPFSHEKELEEKILRQKELDSLLFVDDKNEDVEKENKVKYTRKKKMR